MNSLHLPAKRLTRSETSVVPLTPATYGEVLRAVGPTVDLLYPNGLSLFDSRLRQVLDRRANCSVAFRSGRVAGIAVESPKGESRLKLSTLWVHPLLRRRGVGRTLLSAIAARWMRSDLERAHLTVCLPEYEGIFGLLNRFGFEHLTIEPSRYGEGRDEAVLVWSPDLFLDSPEAKLTATAGAGAISQTVMSDDGTDCGIAAA